MWRQIILREDGLLYETVSEILYTYQNIFQFKRYEFWLNKLLFLFEGVSGVTSHNKARTAA